MFLPKAHFKEGAGFSNLEYGLMAEYLGKSRTASEVWRTLLPVRVYEEKILIDVGHELFGARHGKYGGYCQVWQRIPEEEVVGLTARWQDTVCVLDDGAAGRIERCDQY